ncbi:MAG: hypothetical protein PWP45_550, partial [Tepidanaerobacteraceae bacterium]|nr:hypothetical protein [Tepidanaerobacteraceae bacterium]
VREFLLLGAGAMGVLKYRLLGMSTL